MRQSTVCEKLRKGERIYSMKACYADPELIEFLGQTRVDCMWICLEHRRLDATVIDGIIRSCRIAGMDPLFRVKPGEHSDLLYLLESGVNGIMVPQVRDPAEVEAVVRAMKFPPIGRRGLDPVHADAAFGTLPLVDYMERANANTFLAVQIETVEVVPHIEVLAAMEGVDILFLGLGDLSANMGLPGQMNHPEVQAVVHKAVAACEANGKACGVVCSPETVQDYPQKGMRFFNIGSDFRYIRSGVAATQQALEAVRRADPSQPDGQ